MFLYFVPGVRSNAQNVAPYAFEGGQATLECFDGPEGQAGILRFDASVPYERRKYNREEQTWQKCGKFWLGKWNDVDVLPEHLERKEMLRGHVVELADGNLWTIPAAKRFDEGFRCSLPRTIGVNEGGEWCPGQVHKQYAALWDAAQRFHEMWSASVREAARQAAIEAGEEADEPEAMEVSLTFADELDMVELCLQTNYRISRFEMSLLGLLTEDTPSKVLLAMIDYPTFVDHVNKKKRSESLSSTPGSEDSYQITGQPLPIS